jgi:hypothetical protein
MSYYVKCAKGLLYDLFHKDVFVSIKERPWKPMKRVELQKLFIYC